MLAADGEADASPDAAPTIASVHELGALVRGNLELAADDAEPRLNGLWDLIERRLDHAEDAGAAPIERAPVATPSVWSRLWGWLGGHRSHIATGLVSAGAVAGLALALRPSAPAPTVVVKTVQVPSVAPVAVVHTPPEVESLEVTDGTGTVFTFDDDDDGVSGVIWIEPSEVDPTTEGI